MTSRYCYSYTFICLHQSLPRLLCEFSSEQCISKTSKNFINFHGIGTAPVESVYQSLNDFQLISEIEFQRRAPNSSLQSSFHRARGRGRELGMCVCVCVCVFAQAPNQSRVNDVYKYVESEVPSI